MSEASAKELWQKKLLSLQKAEALVVDAAEKFKLREEVAEAKSKIRELDAEEAATRNTHQAAPVHEISQLIGRGSKIEPLNKFWAMDLLALPNAVVDAASVGAGLWLSYLFVLFYLLIAVGGVTHREIFLESPVRLPFLNVDLPAPRLFRAWPSDFPHRACLCASAFRLARGKGR